VGGLYYEDQHPHNYSESVDGDTSSRFDENFSVRESVDGDTSSRFDENFSVLGDEQMNEEEQVKCK
jgi:hypothetical protein